MICKKTIWNMFYAVFGLLVIYGFAIVIFTDTWIMIKIIYFIIVVLLIINIYLERLY